MREHVPTLEVKDRTASGIPWPGITVEVVVMTSQAASDGGTASAQIAVFLLDDHEVVRRGVRDLLEAEPDIRVVGEAGTASSALARIPALRPDVAILDVRLPETRPASSTTGRQPAGVPANRDLVPLARPPASRHPDR